MNISNRAARTVAVVTVLASAVAARADSTLPVPGRTAPAPRASTSPATENGIVELLERSEAGDRQGLTAIRPSITDAGVRAVVDVQLAASRMDLDGARAAMRAAASRRLPPRWRAIALAAEAGVAFAAGDYALCSRDSSAWLRLPDGTDPIHALADMRQMQAIAERLAGLPRQRVAAFRPGSAATWRDKATLVRTRVTIDGSAQEAVVDTGADLSVVSERTARSLGLVAVDGGSVRSSSRDAVPVRIAVARRLEIAGTTLENVAFLVLKDGDLQLPLKGGYEIPAIIGLPVLRALGRLTFTGDQLTTGGTADQGERGAALIASGSSLFVDARVNGTAVPLHLDSGASRTSLGRRFAGANPDLLKALAKRTSRSAGAGGATEETAYVLRDATVDIGGIDARPAEIEISAPATGGDGNFGTVGQDVLQSTGGFTIDFRRMRLSLASPPAASRR